MSYHKVEFNNDWNPHDGITTSVKSQVGFSRVNPTSLWTTKSFDFDAVAFEWPAIKVEHNGGPFHFGCRAG
jgi:hypothetical protein